MSDLLWSLAKTGLEIASLFVITINLCAIVKIDMLNKSKHAEKLLGQTGLFVILIYAIDLFKGNVINAYYDCICAATALSITYLGYCTVINIRKNYRISTNPDKILELNETKEC